MHGGARPAAGPAAAGSIAVSGSTADSTPRVELPERGTVLPRRALTGDAVLPSAVRSERITYVSRRPQGEDVEVSGSVSIPAGEVPEAGWPVLSWAHGTTGVSDARAVLRKGTRIRR